MRRFEPSQAGVTASVSQSSLRVHSKVARPSRLTASPSPIIARSTSCRTEKRACVLPCATWALPSVTMVYTVPSISSLSRPSRNVSAICPGLQRLKVPVVTSSSAMAVLWHVRRTVAFSVFIARCRSAMRCRSASCAMVAFADSRQSNKTDMILFKFFILNSIFFI